MATIGGLNVSMGMETARFTEGVKRVNKDMRDMENRTRATSKTFSNSFRNAANSVAVLDGPLGGTAGRLSAVATALGSVNPAVVAFGVATAAATKILFDSAKAYADYEKQLGRIESLVKSTGHAAGFSAVEISEMAEKIGRDTLASAAGIRDAAGILLTFRTVSRDTFKDALVLSQDLAAVMGGDAKSAALQLGKALEDPVTGLTALKRSGVSFTEAEKDMIKAMWEAGDRADAQRLILKKLEQQIGGAGVGEGVGLAGAVDLLHENWTRLLVKLGETSGVASAAQSVFNQMGKGAGVLADWLDESDVEKQQRLFQEMLDTELQLRETHSAKVRQSLTRRRNMLAEELAATTSVVNDQLKKESDLHLQHLETQRQIAAEAEAERQSRVVALYDQEVRKNESLVEQTLQLHGQLEAAENFRYATQKARLDEELQQIIEHGLAKEEAERVIQARALTLEQQHQIRLQQIDKKKTADNLKAHVWWAQKRREIDMNVASQAISALKMFAEEGSATYKALALSEKAIGVARIIVSSNVAAAQALATVPYPANIAAAAHVKAVGYASAAIAGAVAIHDTFSGGGSSSASSAPGYSGSGYQTGNTVAPSPAVSPSPQQEQTQKPPVEVHFHGNWLRDDAEWIAEKIKEAVDRDYITFNAA